MHALRWSAFAAVGEALLSLAILAVLSRLLTPRDFGVVAIALIFVGVIQVTGKLGIGPAIVQRPGLTERHVATGFALSAALGVVLSAAVWFASPAIARFFADPEVPAILGALSAVFVITGLGEVSEHLLRRRLRFGQLMLATLLSQAAGYGLVSIALALNGFGAWSLVGGLLARHALFTAAVVACRPPPLRPTLGRREAAELLRFGTGFSVSALMVAIAGRGTHFALQTASARRSSDTTPRHGAWPGRRTVSETSSRGCCFPRWPNASTESTVSAPSISTAWRSCRSWPYPRASRWRCAPPKSSPSCSARNGTPPFPSCKSWPPAPPSMPATSSTYPDTGPRSGLSRGMAQALFALLMVSGAWLGMRWGLAGAAAAIVAARILRHLLVTQLALALLGLRRRRLLRCHAPALWAAAWSAAALWVATGLADRAALPAAATLAIGLAAWAAAAAAAVYAAPAFARPRSVPWLLDHLPFPELGTTGRLLRVILQRLDRGPASRSP